MLPWFLLKAGFWCCIKSHLENTTSSQPVSPTPEIMQGMNSLIHICSMVSPRWVWNHGDFEWFSYLSSRGHIEASIWWCGRCALFHISTWMSTCKTKMQNQQNCLQLSCQQTVLNRLSFTRLALQKILLSESLDYISTKLARTAGMITLFCYSSKRPGFIMGNRKDWKFFFEIRCVSPSAFFTGNLI